LGKKITGASCEAYVFFLKTVPVIFFGALARSGNRNGKRQLIHF